MVAGQPVTITGSGFPPLSPVQAELFSTPVLLGITRTDVVGRLTLVVTVPVDTAPGAHTLRVSVIGGTAMAETRLVVTPRALSTVTTRGVTGTLSRTGSDVTGPAQVAGLMVMAGLVLVGLSWTGRDQAVARCRRWVEVGRGS